MRTRLAIESEGRELVAHAFAPTDRPASGAGILFVHGWESSQTSHQARAERSARDLGAVGLTFDLTGHGESGTGAGAFTPHQHLADAVAGFDLLAGMDLVDPARIGICGASYGGFLAALLIARRQAKGLLLRAPALYPDAALDLPGDSRPPQPWALEDVAPLRNLATFAGPVLVVESENDEVIPHAWVEAYLSACPQAEYAQIPDAAHAMTDPRWNEAFVELILSWSAAL